MSRTYRDRPRRLVEEDARRAGFVAHLRPYGPLPCDRVEIAAYTHSLKSRRHIPLWHQDGVDDDFGSTRVKAALAAHAVIAVPIGTIGTSIKGIDAGSAEPVPGRMAPARNQTE